MTIIPCVLALSTSVTRRLVHCIFVACACLLAAPRSLQASPSSDTTVVEVADHPTPPATLQLIHMASANGGMTFELLIPTTTQPPHPVVLVLADEMGERRSSPYVDALLQNGIAVLEQVIDDEEVSRFSIPEFDTAVVALLAADTRLDAARVGVLGFGVGAQVAFRLAPGIFAARALLYPGCKALAQPIGQMAVDPLLLLHGGRDPANPDDTCTEVAKLLAQSGRRVQRIRYAEAGYAWDHPAYGLEQRMLLPRSDGLGKVIVLAWPALTAMSAAQVAGFLGTALAPKGR